MWAHLYFYEAPNEMLLSNVIVIVRACLHKKSHKNQALVQKKNLTIHSTFNMYTRGTYPLPHFHLTLVEPLIATNSEDGTLPPHHPLPWGGGT